MKRKKMNIIRRAGICGALAAALTAGLAGCGAKESAGTAGTEPASASDSRAAGGEETRIAAGADGFQIEGDGASVSGNTVTISRAGTYRLSGDMADGNLLVNAEENDEIRLVFDGFSIASADIAPIYVSQCGSVTVETAAGTENSVTDGRTYEKTEDDESPDAAIFSECDLILEGEGTLTVSGQFQEGIRGKDDVTVTSGTIRIEALNDGLKGKDAVCIEGGTLEITAGDDGIQSDNEKDSDKGFVTVSGGTVTIDAVGKGIQGESRVDISGGKVAVVNSEEGIEALVIEISGGEVDIFAADDGINAAGSSGMAGEPGAAGGSGKAGNLDLAGEAGGGRHPFGGVTEGACITISGGTLRINAGGDAIDSNGDLNIEGGAVYLEGPTSGGDGILDFAGNGSMTGGILAGTGSAGMMQLFEGDENPAMIVVYFEEWQSAGTTVTVADSAGNVLEEVTPEKEFEAFIYSSPELEDGAVYVITAGDGTDAVTQEVTVDGSLTQVGERAGGGFGGRGFGGGGGRRGGAPGEMPDGMPGERPDGAAGEMSDGTPGERPGRAAGEMSDGAAGEQPDGAAGERPDGTPGERPGRFGGERPDGASDEGETGAAGERPARMPGGGGAGDAASESAAGTSGENVAGAA